MTLLQQCVFAAWWETGNFGNWGHVCGGCEAGWLCTSRWSAKAVALVSSENLLCDNSSSEGIGSAFYLQISKFLT